MAEQRAAQAWGTGLPVSGPGLQVAQHPTPGPTREQREFLPPGKSWELPGFSQQAFRSLALRPPPCTNLKSQVRRQAAGLCQDAARHTWGFHTWLDVGRLPPAYPARPHLPYDSSVWRWLTHSDGSLRPPADPPVPPPSRLGANSFLAFIRGSPVFLDEARRKQAMDRTLREMEAGRRLKLRSEARAPPLDSRGHIVPPKGFQKYRHVSKGGRLDPQGPRLLANPLPNELARSWPCPNPVPHYQEKAQKLALLPSVPLSPQMLAKYRLLVRGQLALPCFPLSAKCSGQLSGVHKKWLAEFEHL